MMTIFRNLIVILASISVFIGPLASAKSVQLSVEESIDIPMADGTTLSVSCSEKTTPRLERCVILELKPSANPFGSIYKQYVVYIGTEEVDSYVSYLSAADRVKELQEKGYCR